ncbi:MAG: hypothetical protein JOY96_04050 [Verrucomicrobia bacterium]|nr:hypothetical protein [Verrucomicrobiota bacterium]
MCFFLYAVSPAPRALRLFTTKLSRFQFFSWTAAAIFGYIVLTLAQTPVQGRFVFADIPQGLPGIIAIGAVTTVAAQSITSFQGGQRRWSHIPGRFGSIFILYDIYCMMLWICS